MTEDRRDEVPRVPRRRWWLWAPAGCLGFVVALLVLGGLVVSGRARSRWKDFTARHAQLRSRVEGRPAQREPLEPPSREGNAFDGYLAAGNGLQAVKTDERDALEAWLSGKAKPEEEARAFAALDAHAADLQAMRDAAHAGTYVDGLNWDAGWAATLEWLRPFRVAGRTMAASARRRRLAGDLDGAIDDVAATAQLGLDCASTGPVISGLVGCAILQMAAVQAADLLADPRLSAAQATRLERLFSGADARLRPLPDLLEADHCMIDITLAALAEGRGDLREMGFPPAARALAWRQGFSWRIVAADVHDACEKLVALSRETVREPWGTAWPRYQKAQDAAESDPILSLLFTSVGAVDRGHRATRARLRLLAAGAHERATGAPPDPAPEDPFTIRPLHRGEDGGKTTWWSEWTDGDQHGTGTFADEPAGKGDIVLELPRAK